MRHPSQTCTAPMRRHLPAAPFLLAVIALCVGFGATGCGGGSPADTPAANIPVADPVAATGQIVFSSVQNEQDDVYIMNADGTGQRRITGLGSADMNPDFSPDGTKILFYSFRNGSNGFEIYTIAPDGSDLTRLTFTAGNSHHNLSASWSPDGKRIAFSGARDRVHENYEIYVMNADGTGEVRLTTTSADQFRPAWSPDGTRIAFSSTRDGARQIYAMDTNGGSVTSLSKDNGAWEDNPSWSPDGTRIAFHTNVDGNYEIYSMDADGSNRTRLTDHLLQDLNPAWSPDGTRIAFDTLRHHLTEAEIYVMNSDGSGQTRLTFNPDDDRLPNWKPLLDD